MTKFYLLLAVAALSMSCMKDVNDIDGRKPGETSTIPSDFDWKTTRDVAVAVSAPTVGGVSESANIRIYSSPILYPQNIIAKGVAQSGGRFASVVTLPAGVDYLYVQTTLPDGTTAVNEVEVTGSVDVAGAVMKQTTASKMAASALSTRAKFVSGIDELDIPELEEKAPGSFDPQAVISKIEAGKSYKLGGKTPYYVSENYLIPAGATITSGIDLDGDLKTTRTLYVAGKLTLNSLSIGAVTLAVLPGGEVNVSGIVTNRVNDNPCIYVFKGGKFTTRTVNLTNKIIVNKGTFEVIGSMDANNNTVIYNLMDASMKMESAIISNHVEIHSDGAFEVNNAQWNSNVKFYNWENGVFNADMFSSTNSSVEIWQCGKARIEEFKMNGGKFYFQCYTSIGDLSGDNGQINVAGGTGLDVEEIDFNSGVKVSLGIGSILTVDELKTGGADFTSEAKKNTNETPAVIVITDEADCASWGTSFKGSMEVVYDATGKTPISEKLFQKNSGAYLRMKQTVTIEPSYCNNGKAPVDPDPDPLPGDDYQTQTGSVYSYAFEDLWPWLGDYDMNDVVLVCRIDREQSKDGSLVKSMTINWKLQAAGTKMTLACALQLDKILTGEVAGVVDSHKIGSGAFAAAGVEPGNEYAVIPLFNNTSELLSGPNTFRNEPYVTPVMNTTKITFAQPVDVAKVTESAMNYFIAVNGRETEVHVPGYHPTASAVIRKGLFLPEDPYRFYASSGVMMASNYLMWGLVIPGEFRYPAESYDIRKVYTDFNAWASSGGKEHKEWYLGETDDNLYK